MPLFLCLFCFQLFRLESLELSLTPLSHTPPNQSIKISCWLYLLNITQIQPLPLLLPSPSHCHLSLELSEKPPSWIPGFCSFTLSSTQQPIRSRHCRDSLSDSQGMPKQRPSRPGPSIPFCPVLLLLSPSLTLLHSHWLPYSLTSQARSCLRALALAIPSPWNALPPYLQSSLPHVFQVFAHMSPSQ